MVKLVENWENHLGKLVRKRGKTHLNLFFGGEREKRKFHSGDGHLFLGPDFSLRDVHR